MAKMEKKFDIRCDTDSNRLYLILDGFLDELTIIELFDLVKKEYAKLKPSYDVIIDMSSFKPVSSSVAERINEIKTFLEQRGSRTIINVSGKSNKRKSVIKESAITEKNVTVTSIMDAEELLKNNRI
jgi:anti-anti-sigma regulatory factor